MLSLAKSLLKKFTRPDQNEYYPHEPRVYAYHRKSAKRLVAKHHALIEDARECLCFKDEDFDKFVAPLIDWLASYVLLLPASEYYHHTLPGSLFYHSLQTANYAAYFASSDPRFKFYQEPQDRPAAMVFIPFAAWVSGLTHDMSKAGTDMIIKCREAKHKTNRVEDWAPDIEPLDSWCQRHRVIAYTAIFIRDRDPTLSNNLRSFYLNLASNLIPKEWTHFSKFNAILNSSIDTNRPLYSVVKKADQRSLFLDKNNFHKEPHIMRESAVFMSAIQDMDSKYGSMSEFDLYYRSEWGIHVPYPNGVRKIVEYINTRFSDLERIQVIESNNIDIWINRLGHSYSLLQPHYQDTTFERNERIHPFVYPLRIKHKGTEITVNCITIKQFGFILANGEVNTVEESSFFTNEPTNDHSQEQTVAKAKRPTKPETERGGDQIEIGVDIGCKGNHSGNENLPEYIKSTDKASLDDLDISDKSMEQPANPKPTKPAVNSPTELTEATTSEMVETTLNDTVDVDQPTPVTFLDISSIAQERDEPEIAEFMQSIPQIHPMRTYVSNTPSLGTDVYLSLMLILMYQELERKPNMIGVYTEHVKKPFYFMNDGLYSSLSNLGLRLSIIETQGLSAPTIQRVSYYVETLSTQQLDAHSFGRTINQNTIKYSAECASQLLNPIKSKVQSLIKEGKVVFSES